MPGHSFWPDRIRSCECTFCADCVETILQVVCPNCGGHQTQPELAAQHIGICRSTYKYPQT